MDKLGAHSWAQMIALAYQQGLVTATLRQRSAQFASDALARFGRCQQESLAEPHTEHDHVSRPAAPGPAAGRLVSERLETTDQQLDRQAIGLRPRRPVHELLHGAPERKVVRGPRLD
jgi:hypothetical protein